MVSWLSQLCREMLRAATATCVLAPALVAALFDGAAAPALSVSQLMHAITTSLATALVAAAAAAVQ
jgi:hypothetical protein